MDTRIVFTPRLNPENCIGTVNHSPKATRLYDVPLKWIGLTIWKKAVSSLTPKSSSNGQALGLLVLLCFTHYCAST